MTTIADKALLLRIQDKDNNLKQLIDTVIRTPDISESVLDALDRRIENEYLAWSDLLPYLQKYRRQMLFKSIYERQQPNEFDAAELFKMGYGGKDIENWLCKKLYDTSKGKGLGLYSHIFDALSESGNANSLEMMEVIRHELDPVIKTNRIVANSISERFDDETELSIGAFEQLIKNKFLSDFSEKLESAIQLLQLRGVKLPDELTNNDNRETQAQIGRRDRVEFYMEKVETLLPKHPHEAMNNMRKAAEAICKDILDSAFNASANTKSKPAKAFNSLEDMLSEIRRNNPIPITMEKCLASLQNFGNFASHDQEENPNNISPEMASASLVHLKTVVEWYKTLNLQVTENDD